MKFLRKLKEFFAGSNANEASSENNVAPGSVQQILNLPEAYIHLKDFMEELSFCPEFDINKVEEMGSKSRRVLNAMGHDALVPSVSPDKKVVVFAMLDESISGCIDSLMIIIPDKKIKKTVKVKFKHSPECWVEIGDVEYDGKELIVHFEYDDIDGVLDEVPENPTFTYLVADNKVKLVSKSE